ncbi:MAG: glycosyltransferase family 2 protein [Ruminococcus flavefaciens]|nr:glycosyltransferase family 2 protein [Ruminococcus flavefaciens]
MSKEKKLSIIIPHYNCPGYLRTLLRSIPYLSAIQIIVVDDKSTDHREEYDTLKEEFSGKNIEFYDNEEIKSAGTCRNIGLRHAVGDWLLFADSDDYFMEGFYDAVSRYFDAEYDIVFYPPTSIVIGTDEVSDRHVGHAKKVHDYCVNPDWKNTLELRYKYQSPCSKLIRRRLVEENGIWFDETIASNDVMFSMKCGYAAKKISVDLQVIYCITMNKGSLTNQISEEVFDARMDVFFRRFQFLNKRLTKEEMAYMQIDGRVQVFQALQNGYGVKKAYGLLRQYREYGIRFWNWDLILKLFHYVKVVFDQIIIRRRDEKYVVK